METFSAIFEKDQQQRQLLKKPNSFPKRLSVVSNVFVETAGVGQLFDFRFRIGSLGFTKSKSQLNVMKCEDLQLNISLYADNDLTAEEQAVMEEHLVHCPPCRVKLSQFQALRNDLRALPRPVISPDLVYSVRSSIAAELKAQSNQTFQISSQWREWLQLRFMPYAIGTAVSLLIGISFLLTLDSARQNTEKTLEIARVNTSRSTGSANTTPLYTSEEPIISNEELVAMRTPVSSESPSLNTKGALLALTKSIVRGKMKNNEVTLVADVFGNGLAQITEVVEAPQSQQSLEQLSNALENDEEYAPFVSADMDKRSNVVRVVFKIQRVDVFDKKPAKKKSLVK